VGAWFLLFKAKAMNAFGEDYQEKNYDSLKDYGYVQFRLQKVMDDSARPWVLNPGAAGRTRPQGGPSCAVLTAHPAGWYVEIRRFETLQANRT
jgi:hypothetical protein